MARATLELPSLLAHLVDSPRQLDVEGETVGDVVDALLDRYPALRVHFFDETGTLRRFVLCFLNGENTAWYEGLETRIRDHDTITVLQSVQGG